MTTEDDFQRQLDAHPDDFQTRLVLADWLEERGDERAEGYRALGMLRLVPVPQSGTWAYGSEKLWLDDLDDCPRNGVLPDDWFKADSPDNRWWTDDFEIRRVSEDQAASAFLRLPADRRRELLAGTPTEVVVTTPVTGRL